MNYKYIEIPFIYNGEGLGRYLIKFKRYNRDLIDTIVIDRFEVIGHKGADVVEFVKSNDGFTFWRWKEYNYGQNLLTIATDYQLNKCQEKYLDCKTEDDAKLIFEVGD